MLFSTGTLLEMFAMKSNRYYHQTQVTHPSPMKWCDITVEEAMAYIGLVIVMGIVRLPATSDYWCRSLNHPKFITLNRLLVSDYDTRPFEVITRYIHLVESVTQPERVEPGAKLFSCVMLPTVLNSALKRWSQSPNEYRRSVDGATRCSRV